MAKANDINTIIALLIEKLKTSSTTKSLNNLNLNTVVHKNNNIDKNDASKTIKKLTKFQKYQKFI